MNEIMRGSTNRNSFLPWEIEILLDLDGCDLSPTRRLDLLRRYRKAVQRDIERGAETPLRLSDYMARNGSSRRRKS